MRLSWIEMPHELPERGEYDRLLEKFGRNFDHSEINETITEGYGENVCLVRILHRIWISYIAYFILCFR